MTARDSNESESGCKPIVRIDPDGWYSRTALMKILGIGKSNLELMREQGLTGLPFKPERFLGSDIQEVLKKLRE